MPETRKECITPAKARKYLERCVRNRPVSDKYVKRLAAAIKKAEWKLNGETLKFNDKDQLEDGQHRCHAVIVADMPMVTFVTRGLPSDDGIFETIDTGLKRTVAHMFARAGERHYALLAGGISYLWRYQNGMIQTHNKTAPRHSEAMKVLEENPRIRDSLQLAQLVEGLMSPSLACCLHYLFAQKSAEEAGRFFGLLASGENISRSNPGTSGIYWLRSRLQDNRASKEKLPPDEICPLVIKAWNAFRASRVIKTLRWNASEDFPQIA